LARKEQCLALGTQLRTKSSPASKISKIYRIFPVVDTNICTQGWCFPRRRFNEGRAMSGLPFPFAIGDNPNHPRSSSPVATPFGLRLERQARPET